ncbi:hypothetical protein PVAP13_3NG101642 [Panicum virgatum]|uniref:Transposase, Ptta/En/Spm, plant n=1 Tax=Panicum virgatum TaxID=38727 RepID=A0A8T0UI52_PANVG|nr:hypothetical protein PVAP13_3NG101642 [Panicum virgatum]
MAPGSRQTKASRNPQGARPSSMSTRSRSEPSANTHVPQERSQARVEEELIPPSAFESREVNTPLLLRSSRPISDANEGTCSMSPMDQASDIAGQDMPILDEGLNKLTNAMGSKMCLAFVEGKKRPEHPVQAAKLASESGILVRNHMPIYPHWKDYKKKIDTDVQKDHLGYLAIRFNLDVADNTTKKVCSGLLKDGVRQERYKLKRDYFNGVPEDQVLSNKPPNTSQQDWAKLVEKWNNPKHKATCAVNKRNRGEVKLHQTTGSQSYVAKRYCVREQGNGEEPDSVDLFKASHFSKTKGYTDVVQEVIDAMETARDETPEEGEEPKPIDEIVGGVLSEYSSSSKFLENMGIRSAGSQPISTNTSSARMRELEEIVQVQALQIEKAERNEQDLRATIISQQEKITDMEQKMEETNESNKRNEEQLAILKQKQETTDSLILRLISQSPIS